MMRGSRKSVAVVYPPYKVRRSCMDEFVQSEQAALPSMSACTYCKDVWVTSVNHI